MSAGHPASGRDLDVAIHDAEARRDALEARLAARRADLPLRYWRQQAHYTTPAANPVMARKAAEGGTAPTARIMDRLGLTAADLAERLEVDPAIVEERLVVPRLAPLLVFDGEDAIAPGDDAAARGVEVTVDILTGNGSDGTMGATRSQQSLRFFRPPGFGEQGGIRDLYRLFDRIRNASDTSDSASFPLDGIVFPKVEHPEEVDLLDDLLTETEQRLGLEPGRIRVVYLIESGWAAIKLAEIAERAAPRLSALVFGLADFSADLALPVIGNDHPLATWARAEIVATAGAVGVPAIDGMTLEFPVADPTLDAAANRTRWLDRMRLVYDEAVAARELGMSGKWAGHPAQLFAVLLAFDEGLSDAAVAEATAALTAYEASLGAGVGATMIGGTMSDRATDRHARVLLRQATALGRVDPDRAVALGVIGDHERADAARAYEAGRS